MSKILITGATGFVGANLAHRLVSRGADVHIIMRASSDAWRIRDILPRLTVHKANLADTRAVARAVKKAQPEIVYHIAGPPHTLFTDQNVLTEMVVSNILGTIYLLEALRYSGSVERIVNVGSVMEYDSDEAWMQEYSLLRPANAYGASKASQSLFAQYYARFHKMPIVIVRPSLLYGPYEEARRLVPASILAHLKQTPLKLSSPKPRKNFLFVEDALDAFERAAECDVAPGEIINIGAGREYSIKDVVTTVQRRMSTPVPLQWGAVEERRWDSARKHVYDVSKAKKILDWKAATTLDDGLARTVEWFKRNRNLYL